MGGIDYPMRYAISAVVAFMAVALATLFYARVIERPASELRTPSAEQSGLSEPWYAQFERDCSSHDPVRLAPLPSEDEYAVLRAAVAREISEDPAATFILKGQTVPPYLQGAERYVRDQALRFERSVEPSVLQALRHLSSEPVPLESSAFADLDLLFASPDQFEELPTPYESDLWRRMGNPYVLAVSRAGIGCSLRNAFVYVRADCGFRCGYSKLLDLRYSEDSWMVARAEWLEVH